MKNDIRLTEDTPLTRGTVKLFLERINEAFPYSIPGLSRYEQENGDYLYPNHIGPDGERGKGDVIYSLIKNRIKTFSELETAIASGLEKDREILEFKAVKSFILEELEKEDSTKE